MNKQQIFDAFNGYFSKTGIVEVDGEWRLLGKWCEIVPLEDGLWDLWFHDTKDLSKPLNGHRMRIIRDILQGTGAYTELDGEIYTQVHIRTINRYKRTLRKAGGFRKKKTYTNEQLAAMRERLKGVKK